MAADPAPSAPPHGAGPRGAAPRALPVGRWETFANGDDVLALVADGTTLWAGTRAGGLVRWDTRDGAYRQFLRPQDPLGDNTVHDIVIDSLGRKWLATDGGLTVFDDRRTREESDDVWRTYTRASTQGGLPSDEVRALAVSEGLVWVGGFQTWNPDTAAWEGGGLGQLDTRGTRETADDAWAPVNTFEGTFHEAPSGQRMLGLVSDNVTDLVSTAEGSLWVATAPHWRFEKPPVSELPAQWTRVHGGISHLDTRGTPSTSDDVWTATDCEAMQVTVTCHVQAMALDATGLMWAAMAGRGVMFWPVGEVNIIDEESRVFPLPAGPADDFVDAIAFGPADDPDLANTVWLGRRRGGVSVLDHKGTVRRTTDDEWDFGRDGPLMGSDGLPSDRVQAIALTGGVAWLGTGPEYGRAGGIAPLDPASQAVGLPLVTTRAPVTNFLTEVAVGAPGSRWAGHVWLGTGSRVQRRFGAGTIDLDTRGTYRRDDDAWTRYTTAATDTDGRPPWTGLVGDNVHALALDGDRVWLGSTEATWDQSALRFTDGGLALFDGQAWTARTVDNTKVGARPGLRHGSVSSLAVGCGGDLWIGTGNGWDFWGAGIDVLTPGAAPHERGGDGWQAHSYPALAGTNTTGIAVDCARDQVWVSAEHHVTQGDPQSGSPGGDHVGGGVAVYDGGTARWTRYDAGDGLECYSRSFVDCEATGVLVSPDGDVLVGSYGTRAMDTATLVEQKPFYPAVVNRRGAEGGAWEPSVFAGDGQISALERDSDGRLYAGTTRDGAARSSPRPENWQSDRERGGLLVFDEGTWQTIDIGNSGLVANDISDVAVAANGDIWVTTEGWGLARYAVGEDAPTVTPTHDAPTPTASATPTATRTASVPTSATPTVRVSGTPGTPGTPGSATATPSPSGPSPRRSICLPIVQWGRR